MHSWSGVILAKPQGDYISNITKEAEKLRVVLPLYYQTDGGEDDDWKKWQWWRGVGRRRIINKIKWWWHWIHLLKLCF